jgi:hypothetical protein
MKLVQVDIDLNEDEGDDEKITMTLLKSHYDTIENSQREIK